MLLSPLWPTSLAVDMFLHGALSIAAHDLEDHLYTVSLPKAPCAPCHLLEDRSNWSDS